MEAGGGTRGGVVTGKRSAETRPSDVEYSKAGPTNVDYDKTNDVYSIRCQHHPTARAAGVRKKAIGYRTEASAKAEVELFRFAVDQDGAKDWKNWKKSDTDEDNKKRNDTYVKAKGDNVPSKKHKGLLVLNATQIKRQKKLAKLASSLKSRDAFAAFTSQNPTAMDRHVRMLIRQKATERASSVEENRRFDYLTRQRLVTLDGMVEAEEARCTFLSDVLDEGRVSQLVIHHGETEPRDDIEEGHFSMAQIQRVTLQAQVIQCCVLYVYDCVN